MTLHFYHTSENRGGLFTWAELSEASGAVFPCIGIDQATTGVTHYACICIRNVNTVTAWNVGVYFSSLVQNAKVYMAKGLTGKNSVTEQTVANVIIPPVGDFVFQTPVFEYAPLALGHLGPLEFHHIWLKRVVSVNATGEAAPYFIIKGVSG